LYGRHLSQQKSGGTQAERGAASRRGKVPEISRLCRAVLLVISFHIGGFALSEDDALSPELDSGFAEELETTVVKAARPVPTRLSPAVSESFRGPVIDDAMPKPDLDAIVSTSSRVAQFEFEAPYVVDTITAASLENQSVRNVPEVFEETPGVLVQKTSNGQGSPIIRGFTGYHNLFLIDGIRLNNSTFRSGPNQYWNTVDSQGLRRIELVKSQGSVLYGSDAVGGTVQALTRRPRYSEEGQFVGGRSYSRYASGENSLIQRNEFSLSEAGKYGLIVGGTFKNFGDIRAAQLGTLPKTGYEEWDADAKLEIFLDEDTRLTLFHQQSHIDDAWRVHKTLFAVPFAGTTVGNEQARILDQSRILSYLQLEGSSDSTFFDHYTLSLSHQQQDEERFRERNDGRMDVQGFTVNSYGAWAQFDQDLQFSDLSYGVSYYQDEVSSFRNDFNADGSFGGAQIQGPVGDDGTYRLLGAFVNSTTPIGNRLTLNLGGRYTYAAVDIGRVADPQSGKVISIQNDWQNVVGSGRLSMQLDREDHLRLFGGVSQAFRAPNLSDLSRLDSSRSNEIETPAPNLDPEKFLTWEIGLKCQTNRLSGSIAYFYTQVNDLILRTPTGRIIGGLNEVTKLNSGNGHVQGVELEGSYLLSKAWSLFGGFAYQDSHVSTFPTSTPISQDEVLSRLMPLNGHGGIRWESESGDWWVEGLVTAFDRADRLNTRDLGDTQRIPPGGTPGYWLATLRSGWRICDDFLITSGVENIFDQAYRAHGSGQNEPGISFFIGAEIGF